jgi:hypothetical protein
VNLQTWAKTDPKVRAFLEREIKTLEKGVWDAVAFDTQDGIDCNTGKASCKQGTKGKMKLVETTPADRALLKKIVAAQAKFDPTFVRDFSLQVRSDPSAASSRRDNHERSRRWAEHTPDQGMVRSIVPAPRTAL